MFFEVFPTKNSNEKSVSNQTKHLLFMRKVVLYRELSFRQMVVQSGTELLRMAACRKGS